jgi:mono/diheme cytochrome c family protein
MAEAEKRNPSLLVKVLAYAAAVVVPAALAFLFWRTTPAVGGWAPDIQVTASSGTQAGYGTSAPLAMSGQPLPPEEIYQNQCARCHGDQLEGTGAVPALKRNGWPYGRNRDLLVRIIHQGRGLTMPSFEGRLSNAQIEALADWLEAQNAPGK